MKQTEIPLLLEQALEPSWLSRALGKPIAAVETVEVIKTVATKARFRALPADGSGPLALCIKGLFGDDLMTRMGGPTMVKEADFYGKIAGHVAVQVPTCVTSVIVRDERQAVVIMRDLIADGATFCSALDPFTADDAAASVEQVAALHAGRGILTANPWITRRIDDFANRPHMTTEALQDLLDDSRGDFLPADTKDAERLLAGITVLASRDATRPQFLVHGDAHAGNIFRTTNGPGLIDWQLLQSGGWALDVAYHLCAVLPVELAETEERRLLGYYLDHARGLGLVLPDADTAWAQYREALVYGFYLWSITRRVDPPIIREFTKRLGLAVARHGSFELLGV